jgi:hypothetical protein
MLLTFLKKSVAVALLVEAQCYRREGLKVVGSIPDEVIGFLNSPNSSSRNMPQGLTKPATEMSTRKCLCD